MYPPSYLSAIPKASFSLSNFIVQNALYTIAIPILVTVVSLGLYEVLSHKKPKIVIECSNIKRGKLGFLVIAIKKN